MAHNKAKHDKTRYTYIKRGINAIFDVYYINTWGHKELDMTQELNNNKVMYTQANNSAQIGGTGREIQQSSSNDIIWGATGN